MLVRCTFEELTALTTAAERALLAAASGGNVSVAAPPRELDDVEALLSRVDGDFDLDTLAQQRSAARALDLILDSLRERVDSTILEQFVGAEDAVIAYFDYAHVLTLRDRVRRVGEQMEAVIELMTGALPTEEAARNTTFPD